METDRERAATQIICDPPPRVLAACDALETAGFRIARDLRTLGTHILIECRLPLALRDVMTPNNPQYQQIVDHQCDLAQRCLKRVGIDADVRPFGWRLVIFLSTSRKPVRKGRPREDRKAREILELKSRGYSWEKIRRLINQKFGESLTREGVRSLARSRRRT